MLKSIQCAQCGREVFRKSHDIKQSKSGNLYCSRSCAATWNNRHNPKPNRRTKTCKGGCGAFVLSKWTYCEKCYKDKHYIADKTLAEATDRLGQRSNRHGSVRSNARNVFYASGIPKCCAACGYDLHIEICHIKGISEFSPETKLNEINHIDNLIALCCNCHWEFDNGLLVLPQKS